MSTRVLDFIGKIEAFYNKDYNYTQMLEVKEYLIRQNLSDGFFDEMFDYMTENRRTLPKKSDMAVYIKENKKSILTDTGVPPLHPQSPMQMFYKYKDNTSKEILSRYFYLRAQQNLRPLKSWEISFIHEWELVGAVFRWNKEQKASEDDCYKRADLAMVEYCRAYMVPDINKRRADIRDVEQRYMPSDKIDFDVHTKNMEG